MELHIRQTGPAKTYTLTLFFKAVKVSRRVDAETSFEIIQLSRVWCWLCHWKVPCPRSLLKKRGIMSRSCIYFDHDDNWACLPTPLMRTVSRASQIVWHLFDVACQRILWNGWWTPIPNYTYSWQASLVTHTNKPIDHLTLQFARIKQARKVFWDGNSYSRTN